MNHIKYNEFPHIFNEIIWYIIDAKKEDEIIRYMDRIRKWMWMEWYDMCVGSNVWTNRMFKIPDNMLSQT